MKDRRVTKAARSRPKGDSREGRPFAGPFWGYLIHLGFNMWADREAPEWGLEHISAKPFLRCDPGVWDATVEALVRAGADLLVIDLGEGVRYESHPELAARGAWSVGRLRRELDRLRQLGLEPIPKLNFSATHDAWLGPYGRCVSTPPYYRVCRDLLREVIDLFDRPRFFHLGMDEETARHQRYYNYVVIRQHDLWWKDFEFLAEQVERRGVQPWIWSDYLWNHSETFLQRMPQTVLQSNWYYGSRFSRKDPYVKAYVDLEAHRYDQVPTGSNWSVPENFPRTVRYAARNIVPRRLKGFLMTVWRPCLPGLQARHLDAAGILGRTRREWDLKRRVAVSRNDSPGLS